MNGEYPIVCKPPKPPLWHYPAIVFISVMFPGMLYLAVMVMISEQITGYNTSNQAKIIMAIAGAVLGVASMVAFLAWEQKRWYWKLTEKELVWGFGKGNTISLSSIEKIVFGMPAASGCIMAAAGFARPDLVEQIAEGKKMALVLMLSDGSMVPLHLHKCVNGTRLMTELVNLQKDKVVTEYNYSPEQTRLLRTADWNKPTARK